MADYLRRYIVCPFYQSNGKDDKRGNYVKCEGGTILVFPNVQIESEHMRCFCCSDSWRRCSIAIFLNKYYERQDEYEQEAGKEGKDEEGC